MLLVVAATEGELRGVPHSARVASLVCGVGPVDAGIHVARRLVHDPGIAAVLHVGIAGCRRDSNIAIGDLIVGSEARYCDSTSTFVTTTAQPDPSLVRVCSGFLGGGAQPIATSAQVGGTSGCDVEAMEGFAVLRAAELAGIPAVEVRCVSNEIEESDRSRWEFGRALDELARAVPGLVNAVQQQIGM